MLFQVTYSPLLILSGMNARVSMNHCLQNDYVDQSSAETVLPLSCTVSSFSTNAISSYSNSLPVSADSTVQMFFPSVLEQRSHTSRTSTIEELSIDEADSSMLSTCRICQLSSDEADIGSLISPCRCTGTLKFVHRKCLAVRHFTDSICNYWVSSKNKEAQVRVCDWYLHQKCNKMRVIVWSGLLALFEWNLSQHKTATSQCQLCWNIFHYLNVVFSLQAFECYVYLNYLLVIRNGSKFDLGSQENHLHVNCVIISSEDTRPWRYVAWSKDMILLWDVCDFITENGRAGELLQSQKFSQCFDLQLWCVLPRVV